jgi:polar amino acid transport system permease protein
VTLPPAIGVFIDLIKGSSVANIFGFIELMQMAINERNSIFDLSPIVVAAVLYFCIWFGLSRVGAYFEQLFGPHM